MRPLEVYELSRCDCCGVLITWEPLAYEVPQGRIELCSESCREVFTSYFVPTHGMPAPRHSHR